MRLRDLALEIKAADPAFAALAEDRVVEMLRRAFGRVAAELAAVDEGPLTIQGFGRFQVRKATRERDGATREIRRVVFRPAAADAADDGA